MDPTIRRTLYGVAKAVFCYSLGLAVLVLLAAACGGLFYLFQGWWEP